MINLNCIYVPYWVPNRFLKIKKYLFELKWDKKTNSWWQVANRKEILITVVIMKICHLCDHRILQTSVLETHKLWVTFLRDLVVPTSPASLHGRQSTWAKKLLCGSGHGRGKEANVCPSRKLGRKKKLLSSPVLKLCGSFFSLVHSSVGEHPIAVYKKWI